MARATTTMLSAVAGALFALSVITSAGRASAQVTVRWEPVGDDLYVESLDFAAMAPTGVDSLRLVGADWVSPTGYVIRTYDLPNSEWLEVSTNVLPAAPVDGVTIVEGPGRTMVVLMPHNLMPVKPATTWVLDGDTWSEQATGLADGDRYHASAAYDEARGVSVVFGGVGSCSAPVCGSTLEWDGGSWRVASDSGPPARKGAAMTYAAELGVVLFGGSSGDVNLDDTWLWDGKVWSEVTSQQRPSARVDAALAADAQTHRVALFGGVDITAPDTWVLGTSGWELAILGSAPPGDKVGLGYYEVKDFAFRSDPRGGMLLASDTSLGVGTWRARLSVGGAGDCQLPTDCESGFCSDGRCCDRACDGACDACSAEAGGTVDGICVPRARGADGEPSCGTSRCDGETTSCPASCASDATCASGTRCFEGACLQTSCSPDGASVTSEGTTRSCGAYRCKTGACLDRCATGEDCVAGNVCTTSATCVPAPAASDAGSGSGGGCNVGGKHGVWLAMLSAAGILALLRRRS